MNETNEKRICKFLRAYVSGNLHRASILLLKLNRKEVALTLINIEWFKTKTGGFHIGNLHRFLLNILALGKALEKDDDY